MQNKFMTTDFILDIIRQGEGQTIEFKEKLPQPKELAREFCAFANSNDGYILVGVNDSGIITGTLWKQEEDVILINIGSNNCSPHIIPIVNKVLINNKVVVVLTIPQGPSKPYKANNVVYARYGSVSRPVDKETELRLLQNGRYFRFDTQPCKNAIVDDLNIETIDRYFSIRSPSVVSKTFDEKIRILCNLDYVTNGVGKLAPTNAGVLCFSDCPQKFFHFLRLLFIQSDHMRRGKITVSKVAIKP